MRRLLVLAGVAAVVAAAVWLIAVRREPTLPRIKSELSSFDLVYQLPGSPQGAASNGREMMLGNREKPWGAMRITRAGKEELRAKLLAIKNQMNVNALTWNGTYYVGLTSASWFSRATHDVFTVHEPKSMAVVSHHKAPPLIGCVAWDGKHYWAATRRHTRDHPEPAHLYRLDEDFEVIATYDAPSAGCQGLAWDGRQLWLVDVFDDAIYVLDVSGDAPRTISRAYSGLEYLSGIFVFDRQVWLTEYGSDRLYRIKPQMRRAWSKRMDIEDDSEPAPVVEASVVAATPDDAPVLTARRENAFVEREPNDTEVIDWSVEIRDSAIYGSWRIWYGPELFSRGEQTSNIVTIPQFAKYTFTVKTPGGNEIEVPFDASEGDNVQKDVFLAHAAAEGEYRVDLFMHVQYVTPAGEARILNNSAAGLTLRK